MPIYEYQCQDCQTAFELMRSMQEADAPQTCAQCQGIHITRKLSLFNASSSSRTLTHQSSSCSSCAGGSCSSCGSN